MREAINTNKEMLWRNGFDIESGKNKHIIFSSLVKDVWEILKGLAGVARLDYKKSAHRENFKMGRRTMVGFEYMDLVHSSSEFEKHPLQEKLKGECGKWPELADDIDAVLLFATNFQEILIPHDESEVCTKFRRLPCQRSYLAAKAAIIQRFLQHCRKDPSNYWRLTKRDLTWIPTGNPFSACMLYDSDQCSCSRVQSLKRIKDTGSVTFKDSWSSWGKGAIIFGSDSGSFTQRLLGTSHKKHISRNPDLYSRSLEVGLQVKHS